MSIKDWPVNEQPCEKLLAQGAHCLSDAELLAVLVGGSGRRGLDAGALCRRERDAGARLGQRHRARRGLGLG
ncbi:MAG: UPF0758 domain-containing protein, partial [Steroidobacteraceae bacterium]